MDFEATKVDTFQTGKVHLSYDQIHRSCVNICSQLKADPNFQSFDYVVAIAKGGIIPAAMIQQMLGIPYLQCILASSYNKGSQADEVQVSWNGQTEYLRTLLVTLGPKVLVVDDIWDTGKTITSMRNHWLPDAVYAVTVFKGRDSVNAGAIHGIRFPVTDPWVVFPWEQP